jgi:hypothetical protein
MAVHKRYPVTPRAVVAWLTAGPLPRTLGLRRVGSRLRARLWRRRLSLLGLLLLTIGGMWIQHGLVVSGGWRASVMEVVVWLEVVLMGGMLLRLDLVELLKRIVRKHGVAHQRAPDSRAKAASRQGPP